MEACGDELAEVQGDLKVVKKALREGGSYLGMAGEPLQRYLLQLSEKENLLISRQLQLLQASEGTVPGGGGQGCSSPSLVGGATAGSPPATAAAEAELSPVRAAPAPPGPPKTFDREDLQAVITHMQEYESSPVESTRALRALSSLAYADAGKVGRNNEALSQLLRLLLIHPDVVQLQLAAMRALCNMAYDHDVALSRLAVPEVMGALVTAVAKHPEPKDVGVKASEALARIVAAETQPEGGNGTPKKAVKVQGPGALAGLFLAGSRKGPVAWQTLLPELMAQLVRNEVVEPPQVAQRFAAAASEPCAALTAAGWLGLAKLFSLSELQDLPQLLTDAGAISQCTKLMEAHRGDAAVQLGGIEAMSSLVGNRWAGLQAFADIGGMGAIEAAMDAHGADATIQVKGVRALSSGIVWPEDIQSKAGYNSRKSMELTRAACSGHKENQELQIAGLEAFAKYLEKPELAKEFAAAGGEELMQEVMRLHSQASKVQSFGKLVLEAIQRIG